MLLVVRVGRLLDCLLQLRAGELLPLIGAVQTKARAAGEAEYHTSTLGAVSQLKLTGQALWHM